MITVNFSEPFKSFDEIKQESTLFEVVNFC